MIKSLKKIFLYLWENKSQYIYTRLFFILFFIAVFKISSGYIPFLYGSLIDKINSSQNNVFIIPLGLILGYGLVRFLSNTAQYIQEPLVKKISERIVRRLAFDVFDHLHELSHDFYLKNKSGGLSQSLKLGIKAVDTIFSTVLLSFIPLIIEFIIISLILFYTVDKLFVLSLMISASFYSFLSFFLSRLYLKNVRKINLAEIETYSLLMDSFINFELIKLFSNKKYESKILNTSWQKKEQLSVRTSFQISFLKIAQEGLISFLYVIFLFISFYQVKLGRMSVGQLVMAMTYLTELLISLRMVVFQIDIVRKAVVEMESVFKILNERPLVKDKAGALPIIIKKGEIKLENVSFGYNPKHHILNNVSFTIPAGSVAAILGKSGTGKTTISRLVLRLYDVKSGRITIDSQDIREVTQDSLRQSIGVVSQEINLFNKTIAFNISYPKPNATMSEIIQAAKLAKLHDFIMRLPQKYDTQVGERGLKLSGGEKQRLALARVILKDPKILVFDEATSSLDSCTEKDIQNSIQLFKKNKTVIIIAHRLSTITMADDILVFDSGSLIEQGSHKDLLSLNGLYSKLWKTGSILG